MCAIFGILGEYNPTTARKCLSLLHHRGPDFCNIVESKNLFFAHNRLNIMDTKSDINQP